MALSGPWVGENGPEEPVFHQNTVRNTIRQWPGGLPIDRYTVLMTPGSEELVAAFGRGNPDYYGLETKIRKPGTNLAATGA